MLLKGTFLNSFSLPQPLSLSLFLSLSFSLLHLSFSPASCSPFLSLCSPFCLSFSQSEMNIPVLYALLPCCFASLAIHNNRPNGLWKTSLSTCPLFSLGMSFVTVTMLYKDACLTSTITRHSSYRESSLLPVDLSFCICHILLFSWYLKWFFKTVHIVQLSDWHRTSN